MTKLLQESCVSLVALQIPFSICNSLFGHMLHTEIEQ